MIAVIAFVLAVLNSLFPLKSEAQLFTVAMAPEAVEDVEQCSDDYEWELFNADAHWEYSNLFTDLFNATEVKWSKNGRLMVKGANAKSFKFVSVK